MKDCDKSKCAGCRNSESCARTEEFFQKCWEEWKKTDLALDSLKQLLEKNGLSQEEADEALKRSLRGIESVARQFFGLGNLHGEISQDTYRLDSLLEMSSMH